MFNRKWISTSCVNNTVINVHGDLAKASNSGLRSNESDRLGTIFTAININRLINIIAITAKFFVK
jgi:hypothetical protein